MFPGTSTLVYSLLCYIFVFFIALFMDLSLFLSIINYFPVPYLNLLFSSLFYPFLPLFLSSSFSFPSSFSIYTPFLSHFALPLLTSLFSLPFLLIFLVLLFLLPTFPTSFLVSFPDRLPVLFPFPFLDLFLSFLLGTFPFLFPTLFLFSLRCPVPFTFLSFSFPFPCHLPFMLPNFFLLLFFHPFLSFYVFSFPISHPLSLSVSFFIY
jgi:hypothetical protein